MTNFENIMNNLENEEVVEEKELCKVEVVSLGGVNTTEIEEGTTVEELRENLGLNSDVKILDEDGEVLSNSDVIDKDITLYTSIPKKNGK